MNYKHYKDIDGSISPYILKLDDEGNVVMCIPAVMDNVEWAKYQEWLSQGNTPLPADS